MVYKKISRFIKELIFGKVRHPVDFTSTGYRTTYPDERLPRQQWLQKFNAGMLYDRKTVEIDNH